MALNYKKQKNLVRSPDEYTRYYGNFRGVDFSSDQTEVHEQRFAYSINMYKDYRTGEGNAIETIPGFRRRFEAPVENVDGKVTRYKINGIHEFQYVKHDGTRDKDILVHAGNYIFLWDNFPYSVNVPQQYYVMLPENKRIEFNFPCAEIIQVHVGVDSVRTSGVSIETSESKKYFVFDTSFDDYIGNYISVEYYEKVMTTDDAKYSYVNDAESKSFTFNNRLYIMDGTKMLVYYKNDDESFTLEPVYRYDDINGTKTYIPTVYRNLGVGDNAPEDVSKYEYEQKNLINPYFKHHYIAGKKTNSIPNADGTYDAKWMPEYPIYDAYGSVFSVYVGDVLQRQGVTLDDENVDYIVRKRADNGSRIIEFKKAPAPENATDPIPEVTVIFEKGSRTDENGAHIVIASEDYNKIGRCTIVAAFDKRIFVSGNPLYPNRVWYCGYNNEVGYEDVRYFGELDFVDDGVENAPITGLIPVADTLAVLKNFSKQDGSVYFHTRLETGSSAIPVTYPSQQGLSGIGCLGACINFLDDPIFISRLGVEAIGQLSVRLERAIEHRSSLIDAKLVNLDLKDAKLAEWDGYLVVLTPDGKMFLADSRQKYTHEIGVPQYEWYYLEGIGVYEEQYDQYYYASEKYAWITDTEVEVERYDENNILTKNKYPVALATEIYDSTYVRSENLLNSPVERDSLEIVNGRPYPDVQSKTYDGETAWFVVRDTWDGDTYVDGEPKVIPKAIICDSFGSKTGGKFYPAKKIVTIEEDIASVSTEYMMESQDANLDINANIAANIFFGTDNGVVCSFNFDMKNRDGTISPKYYSFDNRAIYCGIATKMDNCGIPHLTKSTIKKSTVIKTKSMTASAAKVRVRTNNKGYQSVARVNSRIFSFDTVDFSDFSFVADEQSIFAIKEKEKHWVEKQHWIYSDEYQRPFAVHYLAFRYKISGRIKG